MFFIYSSGLPHVGVIGVATTNFGARILCILLQTLILPIIVKLISQIIIASYGLQLWPLLVLSRHHDRCDKTRKQLNSKTSTFLEGNGIKLQNCLLPNLDEVEHL